jgi:bifunctional DNA-binding transcriptional regulator/antitoxin component of YhaV-PrlF toxin-antitoxin module
MPQLVKGGKWTFGWSVVSGNGTITIPPEAFSEYDFHEGNDVVLMSGSRTSGGFGVTTRYRLSKSKLAALIKELPEPSRAGTSGERTVSSRNRLFYYSTINNGGTLNLPSSVLAEYGIKTGDTLLVIRGSSLALGFIIRGPIVQEAFNHPELEIY